MGCGAGQKESFEPIPLITPCGVLRISIKDAHLTHDTSMLKMDPYIILKLNNKEKRSEVIKKGDKEPIFLESFDFLINSCRQFHGRSLTLTVMDKKKLSSDSVVGHGAVDVSQIINLKKSREEFKVYINHLQKEAGYVNIVAEFKEEPTKAISFKFDIATLRRKTSTFGSMKCWVEVAIGEEVLYTSKSKDKTSSPPTWENDILTFLVTDSIKEGFVTVYDDDYIIGTCVLDMKKLLSSEQEQLFTEEITFRQDTYAGTLQFRTQVGRTIQDSQMKISHKTEDSEGAVAHELGHPHNEMSHPHNEVSYPHV